MTPIGFYPREELPLWLGLADEVPAPLDGCAGQVFAALVSRGAAFPQEIVAATRLIPTQVEMGLAELAGRGLVTADSFAAALRARPSGTSPPSGARPSAGRPHLGDVGYLLSPSGMGESPHL